MLSIDLNCDIGESFGAWKMGNDAELMRVVSSANIACGFHAGDATAIRKTIELALQNGVAVGAHPSYPDLQGFGRRPMTLAPGEIFDLVLYQIAAVEGICRAMGGKLHHVKPHGALYNQAAGDQTIAREVAEAVFALDSKLILYGLSGSLLLTEAADAGLRTASEVFADRSYQDDGSLTPRSHPEALIADTEKAIDQALEMAGEHRVTALSGKTIEIKPDTICIHGDGESAVQIARAIRDAIKRAGITIRAPGPD